MPQEYNNIVNIPGIIVTHMNGINPIHMGAAYLGKTSCPKCGGEKLRKKKKLNRKIRHESIGNRQCILHIETYQFQCKKCEKYFHQPLPGIQKWQRSTESFKEEIYRKHHLGISQTALAKLAHLGSATIERWTHYFLERKEREVSYRTCPKYLGLDEHRFTRKQGFATTFCDLNNNRIMDITLGRSEKSLRPFLMSLEGRDNVEMVSIDLSESYRSIVKHYFPKARITADRFHVMRLVNQSFLRTFQALDPRVKESRGLSRLLCKHKWRVDARQELLLKDYFLNHPEVKSIYEFKQSLCRLLSLKSQTYRQSKPLVKELLQYIEQLQHSHFSDLGRLGNTLHNWREEVSCMWRYTKNNGITEGFHRYFKLIQRRAFGFKNFYNYRLRVIALCC